jgi:hypothetical protein
METTAVATPKITARAIAECLRAARFAAEAIDNTDDGGTCNFDSPAFRIPRVSEKLIQEAAALAGVDCCSFQWFARKRWYWVHGSFLRGQGNWRSRTSHAATKALREAAAEHCPQMEVCEYCQMD